MSNLSAFQEMMWKRVQGDIDELRRLIERAENQSASSIVALGVRVVDSLPSAGNKGHICFLTTDSKFYGDNGSGWDAMT